MFNPTMMPTIDMFNGTNARETHGVVLGTLTSRDTTIQSIHLPTESNSKLDQECTETKLSSGGNTLEDINTELESKPTIHATRDNGGSSMEELEQ